MTVPVVQIRTVLVVVLDVLVTVCVAVLTHHERNVDMVVVRVVMSVRVLVIDGLVTVAMMVCLRGVQVDGKGEEQAGGNHEQRTAAVSEHVGQRRPNERREREDRCRPRSPQCALRPKVESKTGSVSDGTARSKSQSPYPERPSFAEHQRERAR